jgi:hypothetical protein
MTARPYIDAPRRIKARLPRKRAMWGRASTRRYVAAEAPGSFTEGSSKKIGPRGAAGNPAERFGTQVVQLLGASEHRNKRIRHTRREERRRQQRRWAA